MTSKLVWTSDPETAKRLLGQAQAAVNQRWLRYKQLAEQK